MKAVEIGSLLLENILSDMELLPEGPIISEGQDVDLQIEKCEPINLKRHFWDGTCKSSRGQRLNYK